MNKMLLSVNNLSAGYRDKNILQDINFDIHTGEMVGIIGANGSGKSTLLKTLRGLLPLQSGQVLLMNKPLLDYSERECAQKVAYLQQSLNITFDYTAKDIVLLGRYPYKEWWEQPNDYDELIAKGCMEYTGVLDLSDRPVNQVSGGQRQRILLAKVLSQQTPLLFLDEPTTGLDLVYQEEILRFCRTLCDVGKTVLSVLHELSLGAKYCTRFILIGQGGIIAQGTPDEVLTEHNLTMAYGMPVQVTRSPFTGHYEIFTSHSKSSNRENELIKMICTSPNPKNLRQ